MKIKYISLGVLTSIVVFIVFGTITAVLPNPFFTRMTPLTVLDKIFLASSSLLSGAYVGAHYYKKETVKTCDSIATAGGIGSFLAFACPVCNKLLVLLFGATALMTYFEPYRPLLGFVSTGLLAGALYWKIKR